MKTYEKPKLIALSISGNDMLCACDVDVVDPINENKIPDNNLQWLIDNVGLDYLFGIRESCDFPVLGVCRHTSNGHHGQWPVVFSS